MLKVDVLDPPTLWINGICYRKNFQEDEEEDGDHDNFNGGDTLDEYGGNIHVSGIDRGSFSSSKDASSVIPWHNDLWHLCAQLEP